MHDKATVERCAQIAERFAPIITRGDKLTPIESAAIAQANAIAAAIRALATEPRQLCGHPMAAVGGKGMTHWCVECANEAAADDADTDDVLVANAGAHW